MRQITSGAYLMEGLRRAHVYLLISSSLAVHGKLPAWLSRGQFVARKLIAARSNGQPLARPRNQRTEDTITRRLGWLSQQPNHQTVKPRLHCPTHTAHHD
jgi:hypothetical protein